MKTERLIIVVLLLILAFSSGAQWSQAQDEPPNPPDTADTAEIPENSDAAEVLDPNSEAELAPSEPDAVVAFQIPVQGRLTDASGNALNGSHNVTMALYAAQTGGTALCSDLDNVTVINGFFNTMLDSCTLTDINGQGLWLGLKVGSDPEMTPRQSIGVVPYSAALRPGAEIRGDTTYLWVPGAAAVLNNNYLANSFIKFDITGAAVQTQAGNTWTGIRVLRIPITIPSVLYGVNTRITQLTVYYRCENGANNYITGTHMYKNTDADSNTALVTNTTDRISNTAASYSLTTDAAQNTLSSTVGAMDVRIEIYYANTTDYVQIGGIRLTLVSNY
jgi:hypothetical protein